MKTQVRGFTLIELLIVICIIAIMIALVLPAAGPIIDGANRAKCAGQLHGLMQAYVAYITNNNGQFAPIDNENEYNFKTAQYEGMKINRGCIIMSRGSGPPKFGAGFGPLVFDQQFKIPQDYFVCPVMRGYDFDWWHDQSQGSDSDLFHGGRINRAPDLLIANYYSNDFNKMGSECVASYTLRPGLYPLTMSQLESRGFRAYIADNLHHPDVVKQRHKKGVSVGYLDGSVDFRIDPVLLDNNCPGPKTWTTYSGVAAEIRSTDYGLIWESLDGNN